VLVVEMFVSKTSSSDRSDSPILLNEEDRQKILDSLAPTLIYSRSPVPLKSRDNIEDSPESKKSRKPLVIRNYDTEKSKKRYESPVRVYSRSSIRKSPDIEDSPSSKLRMKTHLQDNKTDDDVMINDFADDTLNYLTTESEKSDEFNYLKRIIQNDCPPYAMPPKASIDFLLWESRCTRFTLDLSDWRQWTWYNKRDSRQKCADMTSIDIYTILRRIIRKDKQAGQLSYLLETSINMYTKFSIRNVHSIRYTILLSDIDDLVDLDTELETSIKKTYDWLYTNFNPLKMGAKEVYAMLLLGVCCTWIDKSMFDKEQLDLLRKCGRGDLSEAVIEMYDNICKK
jgi:hypothetical protein